MQSSEIIALEQALAAAHITLDLETIDTLLHPDYAIMQPDGTLETKSDVLLSYQSGKRHWDRADVDEMTVSVYDNFARVIGRWSASGVNNGQAFNYQARFISIWIKTNGIWQNISYQSVEI